MSRVRRGVAVVVAALVLVTGAPVTAGAAPGAAEPGRPVRQGDGWRVDRVGESLYRVTLRTAPRDLQDAPPRLVVDGRLAGVATQSPDRTTYTLLTTDPGVARASRVALSYDELPAGRRRHPVTPAPQPRRGPLLPVDPGATGPFAVSSAEYDFGDEAVDLPALGYRGELRAAVYWPDGLPGGPLPLVVFLHGRHNACYGSEIASFPDLPWPCRPGQQPVPSYRGYAYAARALASHGYVVVSVSANAVNALDFGSPDGGALARAQLVLAHLDLWQRWSTTGGAPFGTTFAGRVDLTNVGLMGHSRGGEGVVRAALLNLERPVPYGITAVLPLAPTDFTRPTLPGVAMSVVLPYCDGDVVDLQGAHYVDDSRYATGDDAARSLVLVMGANHNYFNTEWTPGLSAAPSGDDWWWSDDQDPTCGRLGGHRLSDAEQRAVGRAYVAGFFRTYLGREAALLPQFDGSNARAASAGRAVVSVTAQQPGSRRLDVAAFEESVAPGVTSGALSANVCGGVLPGYPPEEPFPNPDLPPCSTDLLDFQAPHWTTSWLAQTAPTGRVAHLRWTGAGALTVPVPGRDVRGYDALTFRAAPDPAAGLVDLVVRLTDGAGRSASVRVSSVSDALYHLPGDGMPLPRSVLRQVRVPLAGLRGVDLSDLRSVALVSDGTGAAYVGDLAFATAGAGTPSLAAMPRLSVGDVSLTEGDTETVATFPVTLSAPLPRPATAHLDTIAVGWQSRTVFEPVQRDVVIPAGVTSFTVDVPVLGNELDDDDEMRFALVVSTARDIVPTGNMGIATVYDDDASPVLTIGAAEAVESDGTLRFPVTLSAPSARYVEVGGDLVDGTATAGADYGPDPFAGTIVFAGETTGWLDVPLLDDSLVEGPESFGFRLTHVVGAVPDPSQPPTVTATILDDDNGGA